MGLHLSGSTTTQLNNAYAFFANVKDAAYGAKGDGATNDTAAIQAAIDAAYAAGGGTVFLPRGTYTATRITLKSKVTLLGESWMASILKLRTGTNADFIVLADVNTERVSIQNLHIHGNNAQNAGGDTIVINNNGGVFTESDPYHLFMNVYVERSPGSSFKMTAGCRASRFLGCTSKLAYNHGFYVNGATDCYFTDCESGTSGQAGFFLEGGNNQFLSCKAFSSGYRMTTAADIADGFYLNFTPRNKFVGCEAQDNARYGFVIIGNLTFSNTFAACLADSNAQNAVSTFAGFVLDNLAQRNYLIGCHSGNQHGVQDYGVIVQGGAINNDIDMKIDSQNTAEHLFVGTAGSDNRIRINSQSREQVLEALYTGQETFSRRFLNNTAITSGASGRMILTYFTCRSTQSVTQVATISGGTASGTPTLVRLGLYTVAANGDLALVASTPSDTTVYAGTFVKYAKAFSASYTMQAGQRYAVGILVVATTVPTFYGMSAGYAVEAFLDPRMGGTVSSLADLPSSVANASIGNTNAHLLPYAVLS